MEQGDDRGTSPDAGRTGRTPASSSLDAEGVAALLADAIDTIQDLFFVFSFDGEMLIWNERATAVTGYPDEAVAEMQPLEFVAPEDRAEVAEIIQCVVEEGTATTEAHLYTADDRRIPYEFTGALLTDDDGDPLALCGTGRDVTVRKRRRAELQEQASRLTTLNHVNAVIRDVNEALVRARTRQEIETTVCELLADAKPYTFAWIGDRRMAGDRVEPRAAAGDATSYLDARCVAGEDGLTAVDALQTGETQVIQSVADDPDPLPWREAALEHGFQSAAAIPLRYRDTDYGVLCLYAPRTGAFDASEREVLTELGRTIGYAIAAAQQRRALVSDTVVEVELGFEQPGPQFLELAAESDATFELEGVVEDADGGVTEFFAVDVDPEVVAAAAESIGTSLTVVSQFDAGGTVRIDPGRPSVATLVAHHGGVLQAVSADADGGRASVELPMGADVRTVVESIADAFPGTELLAQREHERTRAAGMAFRDAFSESLTDRQREVLETAYHAGFFDWPRGSSAEDVADLLEVTPPTFHEHIRRAEAKLLTAYYETRHLTG